MIDHLTDLDVNALDQHMLVDNSVIKSLIAAAQLSPGDIVLDIGAGPGTIAEALAPMVAKVIAVEIDDRFTPALHDLTARHSNIEIFIGDFRTIALPVYNKIVANPPFGMLEHLLRQLADLAVTRAVLILGRRSADALTALPGDSRFNRNTILAQAHYDVSASDPIPASAFRPPMRTSAAIVTFSPHVNPSPYLALANAVTQHPGSTVRDLLWYLRHRNRHSPALADAVASSAIVARVAGKRLQTLSNSELAELAAAFLSFGDEDMS